jgi:hypothetical protein
MPTTRARLATVSRDLSRVQPRAQQGAPPRPTSGLSLGLGRRSPPHPTPGLGLGRSHHLARPQPRPQEKSPPRPTWASDRLRYRGYIITLPLASCLMLRRNKTGVPSKVTPVIGNDSSPRASMTSRVLSSLWKQDNVSRIHAAPTTVLLQGPRHFSGSHINTRTGLKAFLRQPR